MKLSMNKIEHLLLISQRKVFSHCYFISLAYLYKGKMMIEEVKEPYWDKENRRWVLEYLVKDENAGKYIQRIFSDALISITRQHNMVLNEKIKQRSK